MKLSTSPKWQQQNGHWYHFHVIQQVVFFRPQTKFEKVMFSQVSVCPQRGSQSLSGGSPSLGGSLSRSSLSRVHLCAGGSLCRGSLSGGLCPGRSQSRGISVQGASLSRGVSAQGVLCQMGVSVCAGVSVWGSLSWRDSVPEGLCPGRSLSR